MKSSTDKHAVSSKGLRRFIKAALGILTALTIGVILVWALQRHLIYYPDTSEVPPAAQVLPGGQDLSINTSDGLELDAWFAPASPGVADRNTAVLMAPGNAGTRQSRAGLARDLQNEGFAVLLMDYRGYSTNPGNPTEAGLVRDGLAAAEALESQGYPPEQTIYFGESLGGGVIAALLEHHQPAAAVFRSPFTELADVGDHHYPWLPVRTLLRDEYPVADQVSTTKTPISVIRAADDTVIPSHLSAEVAASAPTLVEERVFEDTDHNDPIMFGPEVVAVVARLSDTISN